VHLGIGGVAPTDMAVLMGLNQNGQSINLSHACNSKGWSLLKHWIATCTKAEQN
jgi:hypothetical protein